MGVNGSLYALASNVQLAGSLSVTGSAPVSIGASRCAVGGDLKLRGPLEVTSRAMSVARDVWLAGDVRAPGPASISVGRDAYLAPR